MMSFLAGTGEGRGARGGNYSVVHGAAVQGAEMSIGYNDIWGGVGVDQGWFGIVLPKGLLRWMPSRLSPLAVVFAELSFPAVMGSNCCGPLNGKPLAMVKSPGQVDGAAHVEGARCSPACRWCAVW